MKRWPSRTTLFALCLALAAMTPRKALAQERETLAHQRFLAGMRLYDARDFAGALAEFRASYALYASPNSRLFVARSLRDANRAPEAALEFETAAQEASERARTDARYAATERAAREELAALEPSIARVQISIAQPPPGLRVRINGTAVPGGAVGMAVPVAPGPVEIALDADGGRREQRQLVVAAGERAQVQFASIATPDAASPALGAAAPDDAAQRLRPYADPDWLLHGRGVLPAVTWVGLSLGVVASLGGLAFAATTDGHYQRLREECGGERCAPALADRVEQGRSLQTATNVAFAIGAVALVAGGALFVLGPRTESRAHVRIGLGPGALLLRGAF